MTLSKSKVFIFINLRSLLKLSFRFRSTGKVDFQTIILLGEAQVFARECFNMFAIRNKVLEKVSFRYGKITQLTIMGVLRWPLL